MPEVIIRKQALLREEIWHEGGPPAASPLVRLAMISVIRNPFAGRYEPEVAGFMEDLKPLGLAMAQRMVTEMGGAGRVEGYGKGAIVGAAGEIEHGALWHVPGGYAMREALGDALAIVPSTKKVGAAGARLDVPVTHKDAAYVRSHFDAMEVGLNDAPKADEIALVLVMTGGARIHARMGGLRADQIAARDGLR